MKWPFNVFLKGQSLTHVSEERFNRNHHKCYIVWFVLLMHNVGPIIFNVQQVILKLLFCETLN